MALGRMIREAAQLEFRLELTARILCESHYGELLILAESSSRTIKVCHVLVDAHEELTAHAREDLKGMLRESNELFTERHRYVHGAAMFGGDDGPVTMRTRRLKMGLEIAPLVQKDVASLADRFAALTSGITAWITDLINGRLRDGADPVTE
ncbi:hypothetical protein ACFUMJ_26390 [Streptomyces olivaceus]|nr:hypothetical protein [Streptomyces sp. CB09030]UOG83715.1 hypothetical protein L6J92_33130 [Streptomyces sp. CB09030]